MRECRATRLEALWEAFKFTLQTLGSAAVVAALLMWWLISDLPEADETWNALMRAYPLMVVIMAVIFTFAQYLTIRAEKGREEVEADERAAAKRLLDKYPDLK